MSDSEFCETGLMETPRIWSLFVNSLRAAVSALYTPSLILKARCISSNLIF